MTSPRSRRLPQPPAFITSDDEADRLLDWALGALACGEGLRAVEVVADMPAADYLLDRRLVDLETEIRVRAGIAEGDRDIVLPAMALGDCEHRPAARALLARAVGADWLLQLCEADHGSAARFHAGRPMLSIARVAVAETLERRAELTPAQEAEASAVTARLTDGAWRSLTPSQARRVALREAPAALMDVREALGLLRAAAPRDVLTGIVATMIDLACACEPRWPVLGGPWWSSATLGLIADISEPRDACGRHRYALADCFLELEELPARALLSSDPALVPERLVDHALGVADCALGHAIGSGLAR